MGTRRQGFILQGFVCDEQLNKTHALLKNHKLRYRVSIDEVITEINKGLSIEHAIVKGRNLSIDASYKKHNLLNQRIGQWEVKEYFGISEQSEIGYWLCKCACGEKRLVLETSLLNGESTSCGKHKNIELTTQPTTKTLFEDLYDFLSEYTNSIELNNTEVVNDVTLCLYMPDLKLAINCHLDAESNDRLKKKVHFIEQTRKCKAAGIRLIHIFEYEWQQNKDKLQRYLLQQLSINTKIVYARQCTVRRIDSTQGSEIIDNYHLQGSCSATDLYGLFYNDILVEVMTFGRSRFNKKFDTELLRLCTRTDYKVVGGASKLFKHYTRLHPTEVIVSYCNLSKFTGTVYSQIGMKLYNVSEPNYVYVLHDEDNVSVLPRYQCMKHKLIEQGYDSYMTEYEIMQYRGYSRIYDCGNAVYVYEPN